MVRFNREWLAEPERIERHIKNMGVLAERLHRDGVRLIFMSPSPYDQTVNQKEENRCGVNDALKACGAAAHRLAETVQAGWADFNTPMEAINRAWQAKQPVFTLVGPDRIHPGPVGHLVMAYLFLKEQQVPSTVSEVSLDGRQGEVIRHANCDVADVHVPRRSPSVSRRQYLRRRVEAGSFYGGTQPRNADRHRLERRALRARDRRPRGGGNDRCRTGEGAQSGRVARYAAIQTGFADQNLISRAV